MAVVLESKVAGQLVQDKNFPDWWVSVKPLAIPYFDEVTVEVTFAELDPNDPNTLVRADKVLANFLLLTPTDRLTDTEAAFANYEQALEYLEERLKLAEVNDIWRHIYPTSLVLTSKYEGEDKDDYVQIEGSCDWDEEHGIALVFRRGMMLTRLSQYDGHLTEANAWGRPVPDPLMDRYYRTFGRPA